MLNIEVIKKGQKPMYTPVYVGRPSVLGNPYPTKIKSVQAHNSVCALYKTWLWFEIKKGPVSPAYRELLKVLRIAGDEGGVTLICYCAPLPCHGDIIKDAVIWLSTKLP